MTASSILVGKKYNFHRIEVCRCVLTYSLLVYTCNEGTTILESFGG